MVKDIVFSPDETKVISGGHEKYLRLWDVKRPDTEIMSFPQQHSPINNIVWNSLHNVIVTSSLTEGKMYSWDTRSREMVNEYTIDGEEPTTKMIKTPDDALIILTTKSRVLFWNAKKYVI